MDILDTRFPHRNGLPSLELTWHLKMDGWKTSFLLGWPIFRCYVTFRECISSNFTGSMSSCLAIGLFGSIITGSEQHSPIHPRKKLVMRPYQGVVLLNNQGKIFLSNLLLRHYSSQELLRLPHHRCGSKPHLEVKYFFYNYGTLKCFCLAFLLKYVYRNSQTPAPPSGSPQTMSMLSSSLL